VGYEALAARTWPAGQPVGIDGSTLGQELVRCAYFVGTVTSLTFEFSP
jgi:hypothetical protein